MFQTKEQKQGKICIGSRLHAFSKLKVYRGHQLVEYLLLKKKILVEYLNMLQSNTKAILNF